MTPRLTPAAVDALVELIRSHRARKNSGAPTDTPKPVGAPDQPAA
jgi:hypothetical protein